MRYVNPCFGVGTSCWALEAEIHVQGAAKALPDNAGAPPRRPAQPEKTQKAVRAVGLSKPKPTDGLKPPTAKKSVQFCEPGKSNAKVGSSTAAEVVKKKAARVSTAIPESS